MTARPDDASPEVERSRRMALRALGFVLVSVAGAVAPLVVLPALTSRFGAAGWSSIAIGMSIGSAAAVICELGYGLSGPMMISRARGRARLAAFQISLRARVLALLPAATLGAALSFALAADFKAEAAATAVAFSALGLANTWFFVGTGRPFALLLCDTLPRVGLTVAAAVSLNNGAPLWAYPLSIGVAGVLAPLLGGRWASRGEPRLRLRLGPRRLFGVIAFQGHATSGRLASSVYIALPVALVALTSPQSVAVFAAAERLQRMVLTGLQVLPNVAQPWVGASSRRDERTRRATRATQVMAIVGIGTALVYVAVFPVVIGVLFSSTIDVPHIVVWLSFLVISLTSVSRGVGGLVLVALSRVPAIARSAYLGLTVGVVAIPVGAALFGAAGGMAGEVLAEASVLGAQLRAASRARKS